MADAFIGKNAYAYVNGAALVHLKDWDFSATGGMIQVDPDIGSVRTTSVPGFIAESGTLNFNLTADDWAGLRSAVYAQSAVPLYLYPDRVSTGNKMYLYGNAYLTDLQVSSTLLGTVTGRVSFMNSDTTGFSTQNRA